MVFIILQISSQISHPKNSNQKMDDAEGDLRYPSNSGYSFNRSNKFPLYPPRPSLPLPSHYNRHGYLDDEDMEEENDSDPEENGVNYYNPAVYSHNFAQNDDGSGFESFPKRQKLKNSVPGNNSNSSSGNTNNYEFVPRNPNSSREDWSEHEKFVLLEVWGDRFLQSGRNSLRSEEWVEVAEKVSEAVKTNRSEAQCRLMMDGLKRRYRKEKAKSGGGGSYNGKWAFFKKMDMLMRREFGSGGGGGSLACGVDSGEFVFMDTNVYLERANGNDEMMDSPCESEDDDDEEEENGEGLRVLADSVLKFGEIYEKIEGCRREQMVELGKMRVDFERELELQKKQILERAEAEIAKIREADEGDDDDDEEEEEDEDSDDDGDDGE